MSKAMEALNPYRQIARQVRALLSQEAKLPPNQKAQCLWQLMLTFSDTNAVVAKGDVNTCAITLGNGKRVVGYPHQILGMLDELARQEYHCYLIVAGEQRKLVHKKSVALSFEPKHGRKIYGVIDGEKFLAFSARPNSVGKFQWLKSKGG